jgi:hypothetical protein
MMKNGGITRRTMLRGAGTAIALPFLEAMMPRTLLAVPAAKAPVRMAFFFIPNGVNMEAWRQPKAGGLPETIAPLKPVADKILHITGLKQFGAEAQGDGAGDHARDSGAFLTGAHPKKTDGKDIKVGVSIDQVAAQQIGDETRLPSLELGTQEGAQSGNCDSGYSCAYSSNISWRTPSAPMAKEINPRELFIRLFGDPKARQSEADLAREATYLRSQLDLILEDARKLQARIGVSDREKLDEYLEGIRAVEKQIQSAEKAAKAVPPDLPLPNGIPGDHQQHIRIMMDLLVASFQTDTTRIATFMLANSGSNRTFSNIGVNEGHHTLSHHASDKAKLDRIKKIDLFYVQQLAYLLEKMDAVKEDGKTLLDNSMILYGGAISDGNRHNHDDLPILLAGKGGGTISSGKFIKASGQSLCNLFVSMLDRMKVKVAQFGDSTKRLAL